MKAFIQNFTTARAALAAAVSSGLVLVNHFHTVDTDKIQATTMSVYDVIVMVLSVLVMTGLVGSANRAAPPPEKNAPKVGPYSILFIVALTVSGCGTALGQQALNDPSGTAEFLAQQACAKHYAKERGIDWQGAKDKFCNAYEQYSPWVKPILDAIVGMRSIDRAMDAGDERAVARDGR